MQWLLFVSFCAAISLVALVRSLRARRRRRATEIDITCAVFNPALAPARHHQ